MGERVRDEPALAAIADACLMHLIARPEQLGAFMTATGHDGTTLRAALDTEPLRRGLIDYMAGNEPLMLEVCAEAGFRPEQVSALWQRLNAVA